INSTFYTFPTARVLKNWYNKSPENFLFSVKAPQEITHQKRFVDCAEEVRQLYDVCQNGMGGKLACILFQMPPSYSYSEERLQTIISSHDKSFKNVIEFRHISWWRPDVFDILEQNQITFCSVSYPNLPSDVIPTGSLLYYRLHGDEKLFYSGYSHAAIEQLYTALTSNSDANEIFVYFNNTASIAGVLNALEMNLMTGQ
ncbi:MAG TPA: DUF72 domain-containing protein, partial [Flavobacterium sp.]